MIKICKWRKRKSQRYLSNLGGFKVILGATHGRLICVTENIFSDNQIFQVFAISLFVKYLKQCQIVDSCR